MADLNGDGRRDVISGSYPGEIYLFALGEDRKFDASITLKDESGNDLNVGWAAAVALNDWDGDGDLDLIVGDIDGNVHFVPNTGSKGAPVFGKSRKLKAGLFSSVEVGGDAGPTIADWDGDGVEDLLVGDGQGAVWFFKARARKQAGDLPSLAKGVKLIDNMPVQIEVDGEQEMDAAKVTRSGMRTKVQVVDWNGDKQPDLLVGDFQMTTLPAPELTKEQIAKRDELLNKQQEMMGQEEEFYTKAYEIVLKKMGLDEDVDFGELTEEQQQRYGELFQEAVEQVEGYKEFSEKWMALWEQLAEFEPQSEEHGWVWVYLRKAAGADKELAQGEN